MEELMEKSSPCGESAEAESCVQTESPDSGAEAFMEHIHSLAAQAQALRQTLPGFDLRRELGDPMFAKLTSPQVGLSVEDAYYALHRSELQAQAARIAVGGIARSIQAGGVRPRENSGRRTGSVQTMDYSKASPRQREDLKTAIRNAAAKGEKIYP